MSNGGSGDGEAHAGDTCHVTVSNAAIWKKPRRSSFIESTQGIRWGHMQMTTEKLAEVRPSLSIHLS